MVVSAWTSSKNYGHVRSGQHHKKVVMPFLDTTIYTLRYIHTRVRVVPPPAEGGGGGYHSDTDTARKESEQKGVIF